MSNTTSASLGDKITSFLTGDFVVINGNVQAEPSEMEFSSDVTDYAYTTRTDYYFTESWKRIHRSVKFNPQWKNGTGYLDNMVEERKGVHVRISLDETIVVPGQITMVPGEQIKGVDDLDRRFILTGTRLGGVVVFERQPLGTDPMPAFTINHSRDLFDFLGLVRGPLTAEEMQNIVGDGRTISNIGTRIEAIWKDALKSTMKMLQE